MSFILDAIKKSEEERQLKKGPTLQSVHQGSRVAANRKSVPSRGIVLSLAFAVIVIILWWMWPQLSADLQPLLQKRKSPVDTTLHSAQNNLNTPATVSQDLQAMSQQQTSLGTVSEKQASTQALPQNTVSQPFFKAEILETPHSAASDMPPRNEIKDLWEMPADYQSSVPEMDYSFHVYASKPEQRAIIINGRRLKQGQSVIKGLVLKVITENGVIFHYKQRYFHVDVIEKW